MNNPNLKKWCEQYNERTKIPVFHQAAPLDIVIDDLLERTQVLQEQLNRMLDRILGIEEKIQGTKKEVTNELEVEAKSKKRYPIKRGSA